MIVISLFTYILRCVYINIIIYIIIVTKKIYIYTFNKKYTKYMLVENIAFSRFFLLKQLYNNSYI